MNKLKNINLIIISIIVLILILVFMAIYYINNLLPKKTSIGDKVQIIENQTEDFEIQEITKGKSLSKIVIKKKLNDSELKDYTNYTLGAGKNYYFNYTLILDNNNKMYKIRTLLSAKNIDTDYNKNDYIILTAVFFNKDIFENGYNIGIIQEDYKDNSKSKYYTYYKNICKF